MKAEDDHLSAIRAGARGAFGAAVAFLGGITAGTAAAVFVKEGVGLAAWGLLIAPLVLVPYSIGELWGLLLLPIYGAMFYGLVWRDWNRLVGASVLALATATALLVSLGGGPFRAGSFGRLAIAYAGMLIALSVSVAVQRKRR